MKPTTIWLLVVLSLQPFISLCQSSTSGYTKQYSVIEPPNKNDKNIFIKDNITLKTTLFRKIEDAPLYGFQNFAEFYPNNLYVLVRKNEGLSNWQDELWHYTTTAKRKISSGQGLSFLTQPQQSFIAYTTGKDLTIYDLTTHKVIKQMALIKDPESNEYIQLNRWSLTATSIWGTILEMDNIKSIFYYDITNDKLQTFKGLTEWNSEHININPDKGLILYSDYGLSKSTFNLFTYHLFSQQKTKLTTQKNKDFAAVWLTPTTYEFYDAIQKKRIAQKL